MTHARKLPFTERFHRVICGEPPHGPTTRERLDDARERLRSSTRLLVVTGRDLYDSVREIGDCEEET